LHAVTRERFFFEQEEGVENISSFCPPNCQASASTSNFNGSRVLLFSSHLIYMESFRPQPQEARARVWGRSFKRLAILGDLGPNLNILGMFHWNSA